MSEDLSKLVTESWMQACPTGILVLSGNHVVATNPALERLTRIPAGELLGKNIRDADHQGLQRLLASEGLIKLSPASDSSPWLKCTPARIEDAPEQALELRFYQDVSDEVLAKQERDALARKVEELDLTDALTGLANSRALGNALTAQVTRSRRYQNPLSLGLVDIDVRGTQLPIPDGIILSVSQFLRDRLRWADVIGRYTSGGFMLILPETERDAADSLLSNICAESAKLVLPEPYQDMHLLLHFGTAQWRKGMDSSRLVEKAQTGLAEATARDASPAK